MNFRREKIRNPYLGDTQVENIFLTEYMAVADGDFVKVYLTALMYADDDNISNNLIAKHLGMTEEDVLRAWNYWEECGVIKKHYTNPGDKFHYIVEFINLKEKLCAFTAGGSEERSEREFSEDIAQMMNDEVLRETFESIESIKNCPLESRETSAIVRWICADGLEPQLICRAYKFCAERRGNTRFSYVSSVIKGWEEENIRTVEDAEKYLEDTDLRHGQYKRVMKALGFHRSPTENEQKIIDSWFDEMGFDVGKILEACAKTSGISNPNINYVNRILESWSGRTNKNKSSNADGTAEKTNPATGVRKLYEELRKRKTAELEERKREVYETIPRIRQIDTQLRKMSVEMSKLALRKTSQASQERRRAKETLETLNEEKKKLLAMNGLPEDYLEMKYECAKCKDTGVLDSGERCDCYSGKLKQFI